MYDDKAQLDAALRRWARGIYPLEAGVELLVRSQWAEQLDRAGRVEASENPARLYAYPKVGEFLQASGHLSGGEFRQVTVIASFLGQLTPSSNSKELLVLPFEAQMYEALPGVDHSFIRLVASAVGHAAGMHERSGNPLPWPGESAHWKPGDAL